MIYRASSRGSWLATLVVAPLIFLAAALTGGPARAQIGTGWTEYTPEKNVQLRGAGARYTNENGIETFSTQPGDERAEMRVVNDHRTGTWQFEGWVNVKAGVNGGCIHQVFKFLMIVVYPNDGGEFRQHSYQRLNATGLYDKWVRINTIHDPEAGKADVYIDGTWRGMTESKSPGPNGWYHKYGIYNSSGTRPVVQWRNVKFFRGGRGGPTAMPSDGGAAPDARVDVRIVDMSDSSETGGGDTGAGGAGGSTGGTTGGAGGSTGGAATGGTGGSTGGAATGGTGGGAGGSAGGSGSGGSSPSATGGSSGGSGGRGGRAGSSGSGTGGGTAPTPAPAPASGCQFGSAPVTGAAAQSLPVALGLLAFAWRRARSRRRPPSPHGRA